MGFDQWVLFPDTHALDIPLVNVLTIFLVSGVIAFLKFSKFCDKIGIRLDATQCCSYPIARDDILSISSLS